MYKYGGVTKTVQGGGGSGGGESTGTTSVQASLEGVKFGSSPTPTIVLSKGPGSYKIDVSMSNPNGHTYTVYTNKNSTLTLPDSRGMYMGSLNVNLNENETISVRAYDQTTGNSTDQVSANCVVNAIKFNYTYCSGIAEKSVLSGNNEVFLNQIQSGLRLKIDYAININYKSAATQFTYNGVTQTVNLDTPTGTLFFDLETNPDESIAGAKQVSVKSTILPTLEGADTIEAVRNDSILIIPNNLYIMCIPESGSIYNEV